MQIEEILKKHPNLIVCPTIPDLWEQVHTHDMTIKDMCKFLKVQRKFINDAIVYKLKYVRVPLRLAESVQCKAYDTNLYSRKEFLNLIRDSVINVERRTVRVPISYFLTPQSAWQYKQHLENHSGKKKYLKKDACLSKLVKKIVKRYNLEIASYVQRPEADFVDVNVAVDYDHLMAVHDLKDYGDTDEEVFRDLFNQGCIRITLEFENLNHEKIRKIYYNKSNSIQGKLNTTEEYAIVLKYKSFINAGGAGLESSCNY